MRRLLIILILLLGLSLRQSVAVSQPSSQTQAQNSEQSTQQLTLDQIKERVRIYAAATNEKNKAAIDKAIATEIGSRGVRGFQPIPSVLNDLRKLGAGPKTIQAIEDLKKLVGNIGTQSESFSGKIIILVADFQGPMLETSSVTNTIIDELNDAAREYSDVKVIPLNEPITAKQGRKLAGEKGKEHNASVVLWGWYEISQGQVLVNVHFQVLPSPLDSLFFSEKQTLLLPLADFMSFQIRLSKEMAYLTFFTAGFVRLEAGDFAGAAGLFTKAIEGSNVPQRMVNPADAYLLRSSANILKSWSVIGWVPDHVFDDLQQAISLRPENTDAYRLGCTAHGMRKEFELAIRDCNKAIELEPNEAEGYSVRSNMHLLKDDRKPAIADMEAAIRLASPDDNRQVYYRSVLSSLKGDFDGVISSYSELIEKDFPPFLVSAFLVGRAGAYIEKDLYDLAMADLNHAIDLSPQNLMAYWLLGDVFYNKKDYKSSISSYRRAIELGLGKATALGINGAEVYRDLGDAYQASGDISQAIESFSNALSIDPRDREAYESRASLYMQKNDFDKVIADYSKSIELQPDGGYSYFFRGYAYYRKHDYEKALTDFGKASELMPEDAQVYYFRGIVNEAKGDLERAIDDFGITTRLNPKYIDAYFHLGDLFSGKGNYEQAISEYSRVINIYPQNVRAYLSRAKTYVLKADHKSAISDLIKILQLTSDPQLRKQVEQLLDTLGVKQAVPDKD